MPERVTSEDLMRYLDGELSPGDTVTVDDDGSAISLARAEAVTG